RLFRIRGKKVFSGLVLAGLLALAGVAWLERTPLLAWYYVRGLAKASAADRDVWVDRVTSLDKAALPGLFRCLRHDDEQVCANAQAALTCLVQRWQDDEPGRAQLAGQLAEVFPGLSPWGQQSAIEVEIALLRSAPTPPSALTQSAGRILTAAARAAEPRVRT